MSFLREAIHQVGGPEKGARICEVSSRAVYKWLAAGCLPRTEYTGETHYADKLAAAPGARFTAPELLERCRPSSTQPAA